MEAKEDGDAQEDRPASPLLVLQQISEEAVRVANEAMHNLGSGESSPVWKGHRRCQSEVASRGHRRTNSLQSIKSHIQRAWKRGGTSQEEIRQLTFNPEVLANQKRQWYQIQSKTPDRTKCKEPPSLFDHFIVMGLHPDANLQSVEDAFARKKKWELDMSRTDAAVMKTLQFSVPQPPSLEPQILFKYPPGKQLPLRSKDLCAFSFPADVKARLVERTPSLSDLNELVYGQEHLGRDDLAFVFSLKAADNGNIYGVCLHVPEIVQRPPGVLGSSSPLSHPPTSCSRFLISAPRCYCLLTRVPFFELHYEMLNSIIAQERLNRITQFMSEATINDIFPSSLRMQDQYNYTFDSPPREAPADWMSSAIPIDSAVVLSAAAAGIIPDDEVLTSSLKVGETHSPASGTASEASDSGPVKDMDKEEKRSVQYSEEQASDDHASDVSDVPPNGFERSFDPDNGMNSSESRVLSRSNSHKLERSSSSVSLFSSVRSMASQDEDYEDSSNQESDSGELLTMQWAKENKNDFLKIVCGYRSLPIPEWGNEIVFQPLEHLQAIQYMRPPISSLGLEENLLPKELQDPSNFAEVHAKLAAAEEAVALSVWTTATLCRVLSLDTILALFTGVLLEKQVVIVCPNLGVLSATVLSLIPLIRPFAWQCLMLPILPGKMLDFLDAPVPYIVGLQEKPADLKMKTNNLVHVNVVKDQVKMCYLPLIPRRRDLANELRPIHSRLYCQNRIAEKHPVYRCNEAQAEAAMQFLDVMRRYLESLCSELRSYTITSVQSNNDRVSLLLKESFVDSFPNRDRPFIKVFVDTQMFAVLSDTRLSSYEHESS